MAASRGPHVKDLFIGVHADSFEPEHKKKYIFKKEKTQNVKLGAYKPKILSDNPIVDLPLEHQRNSDHSTHRDDFVENGLNGAPIIMGDKNVPMTIEPAESIYSEIDDLLPNSYEPHSVPSGTSNPVFRDSPRGYHSNNSSGSERSNNRSHSDSGYHSDVTQDYQGHTRRYQKKEARSSRRQGQLEIVPEEVNGVRIPAPDYGDDDIDLGFYNDKRHYKRRPVVREFAGEDFGRYMSEDDDDMDIIQEARSMRARPPVSRKALIQREKLAKTEARRESKPKRDSSISLFKPKPKVNPKNSVRNYSVNDTKLGIKTDGTMKKGEINSLRDGIETQETYESFLQARNGGPRWGSVESSSSDSDVIHGEKANSFWKKLTIRFKHTGYDLRH